MADLKSLKKIQKAQEEALELTNKLISSLEVAPKAPKEEKEKETKNLPRMTPTIAKQLQKEFENGWDDKYKKEFSEFVNAMPKENYTKQTLESHMVDFAKSKPQLLVGGGGGVGPVPDVLTLKELKELKGLTKVSAGVFKTKQGKHVTGPPEEPEESMDEGTFNGGEILIGEKTKRVYNSDEEFMGYWGVDEFKNADM